MNVILGNIYVLDGIMYKHIRKRGALHIFQQLNNNFSNYTNDFDNGIRIIHKRLLELKEYKKNLQLSLLD